MPFYYENCYRTHEKQNRNRHETIYYLFVRHTLKQANQQYYADCKPGNYRAGNYQSDDIFYEFHKVSYIFCEYSNFFRIRLIEGTVECDEIYIGGKEKWKHKSMRTPHTQGRSTKTKTPVFGMMERSTIVDETTGEIENITYVHAFTVENTNRDTLQPFIQQFVADGSRVITDELQAYNGLATLGYTHAVVKNHDEEYVNGDVFTNSIEGFW